MSTIIEPQTLVASADPGQCDRLAAILARCGLHRVRRTRTVQAFDEALQERSFDVAILAAPMFDLEESRTADVVDLDFPGTIIVSDGEAETVHRLMDHALDQRWRVAAILDRPVQPVSLVAAVMKVLRGSDQVGLAARA